MAAHYLPCWGAGGGGEKGLMGGNESWGKGFKTESGRKQSKNVIMAVTDVHWPDLASSGARSCLLLAFLLSPEAVFSLPQSLRVSTFVPAPSLPDEHLIILRLLVPMPFPREVLPIIRKDPGAHLPRTNPHHSYRQPVRQTLYVRTRAHPTSAVASMGSDCHRHLDVS